MINKAANTLTLSATSVNYSYPVTVNVTNNLSGGAISAVSSDFSRNYIAVNGNTITVTVTKAVLSSMGSNTFDVIVKSAETDNYKQGQAIFHIQL